MASSSNPIDFNEIATKHAALRNTRQGTGRPVNDAKLTQITLKAREVQWSPDQMTRQRVPRGGNGSFGTSHSSSENMTDSVKVHIHSGLCKGLHTKVKLPFPGDNQGRRVLDVDPCNPRQSKTIETPTQLTSEPGQSEVARVGEFLEKHVYNNGSFSCQVYPGGFVLVEGTDSSAPVYGQIKTQTVLEALRERGDSSVKDFKRDAHGFYFVMSGQCTIELDAQLEHHWSN